MPLSPFFSALRAYAAASAMLSFRPDQWRAPMLPLQSHVAICLEEWTKALLNCGPRKVRLEGSPCAVVVTDASDWGWGAFLLRADGTWSSTSVQWTDLDRAAGFTKDSVYAEPEAVYRALCRFVSPREEGLIVVLTDSKVAEMSIKKGHSGSFNVNRTCNRIQRSFRCEPYTSQAQATPSMACRAAKRNFQW